jgi:sugar O-acyltransferase (sialic acid O-acetyltransferase NeuD family)
MKDIIIMGAGDLGKDVAWLIERINENKPEWNLLGFTEKGEMSEFQGYPVLGTDDVIENYDDVYVVCALANTAVRERIIDSLPKNAHVATLIDPDAIIHKTAQIGEGSMIFAHALVGVEAKVGKQCVVLYNASVNHDVEVGDYTTVYPNATISGRCVVGKYCEIGTGASVIQHVTICDNAKIGVGAAVFTNIKNPGTTVGNPAVTMGAKKKEKAE